MAKSLPMQSIEDLLSQDLNDLDDDNPSWDNDIIMANAVRQVRQGMDDVAISIVFGKEALAAAKKYCADSGWC